MATSAVTNRPPAPKPPPPKPPAPPPPAPKPADTQADTTEADKKKASLDASKTDAPVMALNADQPVRLSTQAGPPPSGTSLNAEASDVGEGSESKPTTEALDASEASDAAEGSESEAGTAEVEGGETEKGMGSGAVTEFINGKVADIDAAFPALNQTADSVAAKYNTHTQELKNKLESLRSENTGDWVPAATALHAAVTSLTDAGMVPTVQKTIDDHVDPIYIELASMGSDPKAFLSGTNVAKVSDSLTSAKGLATGTAEFAATARELVGTLGTMWKDRSRGLQSDTAATDIASSLAELLPGKGPQVVEDNKAAVLMGVLKNDANGRPNDPMDQVSGDFVSFMQSVTETFRPDAPRGEVNAREEIMTLIGKQDASLENLIGTMKGNQAMLDGQNLPIPAAEDNLLSYSNKLTQFLGDLQEDNRKADGWQGRVSTQAGEYGANSSAVKEAMTKWGWTTADLAREDPALIKKMEERSNDLANSTVHLMDAQKGYANRIEEKAGKWLEGWETTKDKQAQEEWVTAMNTIFDFTTSLGIGGNAIVSLASGKLAAALNPVKSTLSDVTTAFGLRASQVGDMVQTFINNGLKMSNLRAQTEPEAMKEFELSHANAGTALSTLTAQLRDFYNNWDSRHYEGGFSNF